MLQSNEEVWRHVRAILNRLQDTSMRNIQGPDVEAPAEEHPALELRLASLFTSPAQYRFKHRIYGPGNRFPV